ncbi:hypothetical protein [Halorubrum vacuolatum]|uniref:Uncharacterized protein n=1 Tax=Halorubrum vacuolatum TaxID=63740 RepID=A0A238WM68_HALVU|nr:hypothetical protein [Halorubrum vacuolatum]SNR47655.1 hypothetical protein SAMN06264855_108150 [Halorubrum vacuolatum]
MSDRSLTLLEIHLGDATIQIGPKTIGSKMATRDVSETEEEASDDPENRRCALRTPLLVLLVLGVVAAVVAVVWKQVAANGLEDATALDELNG